jgi:hypothetical protein
VAADAAAAATTEFCQINSSGAIDMHGGGLGQQETLGCAAVHSPVSVPVPPVGGQTAMQLAAGSRKRGAGHCSIISSLDLVHTKCRPYFHARDPHLNLAFRLPRAGQQLCYSTSARRDTGPGPGVYAGRGIRRPA